MAENDRWSKDEPEEEVTYKSQRVFAYIIDTVFPTVWPAVLLLIGFFYHGVEFVDNGTVNIIIFIALAWAFLGVTQYLYYAIMEGFGKCTIGERIMKIEVALLEPPEDVADAPIGGKAFVRNAPKLVFPLGAISFFVENFAGCYFREYTEPEALDVTPKRAWKPKEVEEEITVQSDLPFPEELLNGSCPRCGTPYRLNPDGETFSGLWMYRCTWCNTQVFDAYREGRTMPGFL
jgi:hypothetical protein